MVEFDGFGPEKILEVHDPKTGMHGFTVVDNTALGPAKGGIRMTPSVTINEVAKLARAMTWKCSLADLPLGGGKSGIVANDKRISRAKKMEIVSAFSRAIKPICPSQYVAAPDMNMAVEEMAEFAKANGAFNSCTGKPASMCMDAEKRKCGIPHEYGSTGYGVFHSALVAAEHIGLDMDGASIAIEGFGNVGTFTMAFLSGVKARVVAVSDSRGCIYNKDGLDYNRLYRTKKKTGSVINHRPGKVLKCGDLFTLPVDMIIPAAVPDSINKSNVNRIRAKIVVEGANIPATPEIEEKLHRRGILVVPDFVANSGGVISSYAEYTGDTTTNMFRLVRNKIRRNTKLVLENARKAGIKPRDAGMEMAVKRVGKAMKRRSY